MSINLIKKCKRNNNNPEPRNKKRDVFRLQKSGKFDKYGMIFSDEFLGLKSEIYGLKLPQFLI